jgi:hypothetical protein
VDDISIVGLSLGESLVESIGLRGARIRRDGGTSRQFQAGAWGLESISMSKALMALAALGLGLMLAGCTTGPSATLSGPSGKELAACVPIVKVKVPPVKPGMGFAIALPTTEAENLIKSGNLRLAETGRIFHRPGEDGSVYVKAFLSAQTECRKIGSQ